MAATLKDVAKLAEVDIGSVSRTLGNHPRAQKLRPETRQRILDAARKLGYRRNQFAAAMRTGVNATIAIINSGDYSIGHSQSATRVLYGILDAAGASNYALKTYTDNDLPSCIEEILSSQIKHVISMSTKNGKREETAFLCRQYGLNLVFVYEPDTANSRRSHPATMKSPVKQSSILPQWDTAESHWSAANISSGTI